MITVQRGLKLGLLDPLVRRAHPTQLDAAARRYSGRAGAEQSDVAGIDKLESIYGIERDNTPIEQLVSINGSIKSDVSYCCSASDLGEIPVWRQIQSASRCALPAR